MEAASEEDELFRAIAASGARAILFGRRALIALGIPVLTADYDFWIDIDDAGKLNSALEPLGFVPNRSPEEARRFGRYVLENDLRVDALCARACSTVDGKTLRFDDVWQRRRPVHLFPGVTIPIPDIDDLISTKRFAARSKDAEDIRLLELFKLETSR